MTKVAGTPAVPDTLADELRWRLKLIDTLKKELLQSRYRPWSYTTERRSRILQLQKEVKALRADIFKRDQVPLRFGSK